MPDRWRIMQALGFKFPLYDPYNQNVLKGDLPVWNDPWLKENDAVGRGEAQARLVLQLHGHLGHAGGAAPAAHAGGADHLDPPELGRHLRPGQAAGLRRDVDRGDGADQGQHHVQAAGLRDPHHARVPVQPRRGRGESCAAGRSAPGHHAQRQPRGPADRVPRRAPAQRLGPLRLRLDPRRHPADRLGLPRLPAERRADGRALLRHPRQQPGPVQHRLVPEDGEGHQLGPERPVGAHAQGRDLARQRATARTSRSWASPRR